MTSSKAVAVTVLLALLLQGCEKTGDYDTSAPLDQSRTASRAQMHQPPAPRAAPPVAPN
jgi:hypothetical protein